MLLIQSANGVLPGADQVNHPKCTHRVLYLLGCLPDNSKVISGAILFVQISSRLKLRRRKLHDLVSQFLLRFHLCNRARQSLLDNVVNEVRDRLAQCVCVPTKLSHSLLINCIQRNPAVAIEEELHNVRGGLHGRRHNRLCERAQGNFCAILGQLI